MRIPRLFKLQIEFSHANGALTVDRNSADNFLS